MRQRKDIPTGYVGDQSFPLYASLVEDSTLTLNEVNPATQDPNIFPSGSENRTNNFYLAKPSCPFVTEEDLSLLVSNLPQLELAARFLGIADDEWDEVNCKKMIWDTLIRQWYPPCNDDCEPLGWCYDDCLLLHSTCGRFAREYHKNLLPGGTLRSALEFVGEQALAECFDPLHSIVVGSAETGIEVCKDERGLLNGFFGFAEEGDPKCFKLDWARTSDIPYVNPRGNCSMSRWDRFESDVAAKIERDKEGADRAAAIALRSTNIVSGVKRSILLALCIVVQYILCLLVSVVMSRPCRGKGGDSKIADAPAALDKSKVLPENEKHGREASFQNEYYLTIIETSGAACVSILLLMSVASLFVGAAVEVSDHQSAEYKIGAAVFYLFAFRGFDCGIDFTVFWRKTVRELLESERTRYKPILKRSIERTLWAKLVQTKERVLEFYFNYLATSTDGSFSKLANAFICVLFLLLRVRFIYSLSPWSDVHDISTYVGILTLHMLLYGACFGA